MPSKVILKQLGFEQLGIIRAAIPQMKNIN